MSTVFGLSPFSPPPLENPRPRRQTRFHRHRRFQPHPRHVYRAIGGFEALRMEVLEDLRLGYEVKRQGYRQQVVFGRASSASTGPPARSASFAM